MIIELLSPAKNLPTGIAAINSGADAVYIGASRFGARSAAGNSVNDISELAEYAHQFFAKVYVTVNTILLEHELKEVERLIHDLYHAGVDAIIIQDPAITMMKLPPIALHASTQMHNNTPERVKFLETVGLQRVVLARELSIDQIKEIKNQTSVELEGFIHGSLCVSYSGRCYLSECIGGRSANRGECAQPCRNSYDLQDEAGNTLIADKHLLSLRDLNLSNSIGPLMDAGISSFKIEGRLKGIDYVRNITAYYRQLIDAEIAKRPGFRKASSGTVTAAFTPDPANSFNRGYTEYFINGRNKAVTNPASPKAVGKIIGTVLSVIGKKISLILHEDFRETNDKVSPVGDMVKSKKMSSGEVIYGRMPLASEVISNGDGLCWYDASGKLIGTRVNLVKADTVVVNDTTGLKPGMPVMRNHDKAFAELLNRTDSTQRTIDITLTMKETPDGFTLTGRDEDGIEAEILLNIEKTPARTPDTGYMRLRDHLMKVGSTIFNVNNIIIDIPGEWFFQSSVINGMRRDLMEDLLDKRLQKAYYSRINQKQRIGGNSEVNVFYESKESAIDAGSTKPESPVNAGNNNENLVLNTSNFEGESGLSKTNESNASESNSINHSDYSADPLTGKENITNSLSAEFYAKHGIEVESIRMQNSIGGSKLLNDGALMTTKMCLKYELGKCPTHQQSDPDFPKTLYLSNRDGRFRLSFDCKECVMKVMSDE